MSKEKKVIDFKCNIKFDPPYTPLVYVTEPGLT